VETFNLPIEPKFFSRGQMYLRPHTELAYVAALRTETGSPHWLISVLVLFALGGEVQMPVGFFPVVRARLIDLCLALYAVVLFCTGGSCLKQNKTEH
jgi:hypothetical protein